MWSVSVFLPLVAFHGRPLSLSIRLRVMFQSPDMMTFDVSVLDISCWLSVFIKSSWSWQLFGPQMSVMKKYLSSIVSFAIKNLPSDLLVCYLNLKVSCDLKECNSFWVCGSVEIDYSGAPSYIPQFFIFGWWVGFLQKNNCSFLNF